MELAEQKAETAAILKDLIAEGGIPARARIIFQFVADDRSSDWNAFSEAAESAGYTVDWHDADDEDEACVTVLTLPEPISPDGLWGHEERLTLMAAICGFSAEGWGFVNV
jgi:hypothetical protein